MSLSCSWDGYADTDVDLSEFFAADHTVATRFMLQYPNAYTGPMLSIQGTGTYLIGQGDFLAAPQGQTKLVVKIGSGQITYATGGAGTSNHIATEALRLAAGIDIVHVPYKGSSQAVLDVLPGRVPILATVLVEAMPYIQSGKLRPIATTSPKRAPSLPDLPTIRESLPAYLAGTGFWALVARAGTPPAALNKLNADVLKAMQAADVRARLASADVEVVGSRPEQCDAFVREQVELWGKIVKASGARVD